MPIAQATIANSNTTILTVASGQNWRIDSLTLTNFHASTSETLTVYIVPSGSSAANSTMLLKSWALPSGRKLELLESPLHLDAGDALIAVGTTGSLVTAHASYVAE